MKLTFKIAKVLARKYQQVVLSADNLCKQFGLRSGQTKCRAWSGSKLFDILMVLNKSSTKKNKIWHDNKVWKNNKIQKLIKL